MSYEFKPDWVSIPYDTVERLLEMYEMDEKVLGLSPKNLEKFKLGTYRINKRFAKKLAVTFTRKALQSNDNMVEFWLNRDAHYVKDFKRLYGREPN